MAIVIVVGGNSWVTAAEADSYLEAKIGASIWASLTSELKKQYIISAFRWIFFSGKYNISKLATGENVKVAQIETAYYMLKYWDEHEKRSALQNQGVNNFTLSKWSETFKAAADFPKIVDDLLSDFIVTGEYFPKVKRTND